MARSDVVHGVEALERRLKTLSDKVARKAVTKKGAPPIKRRAFGPEEVKRASLHHHTTRQEEKGPWGDGVGGTKGRQGKTPHHTPTSRNSAHVAEHTASRGRSRYSKAEAESFKPSPSRGAAQGRQIHRTDVRF